MMNDFEERFEEALKAQSQRLPVRPNLHTTTISCIVLDKDNQPLWVDSKMELWVDMSSLEDSACESVRVTGNAHLSLTHDHEKRPILLSYVPSHVAEKWPIEVPALPTASNNCGVVVVAAVSLAHLSDELEHAARALGLSNLEARVAASLFAYGSTRQAASHAGVTYHTARKALAEAMRKLQITRKTALVRKLSELATASSPPREEVERILIDMFGLTTRDARLAMLICEGCTRAKAAKILGLSNAVAKDRFAHIFQSLGISSATEIPRLIIEAFAAAMLMRSDLPGQISKTKDKVPLQLIQREDSSVVAVSDFGPRGGKPILIVHSSVSTRHPFRKVVAALQKAGFRPLTIDRPGFGLSDDIPWHGDPFAVGADDVELVCDRLELERLDVLTRGGAFHALALARIHPNRIGRIVVINPDLLQHHCSTRKGRLGIVRSAFDRFPDRIESLARWGCSHLNAQSVRTFIRIGINGRPIDVKSFENEEVMADYSRSILAFSTGQLSGLIREQRGYATLTDVEGLVQANNWTIVLGGDDPIHDTEEILDFWREKLPSTRVVRLPDANRFISLSHTQEIISLFDSDK